MRLWVLALLVISLVAADAATYYVRTDGNDANPGTADTPAGAWKTFGRIRLAGLGPGDVVNIAAGTYDEAQTAAYTFFAAGVTVRGSTPVRPVIQRMSLEFDGLADNWVLENLVIDAQLVFEDIITLRQGVQNFTLRGCDLLKASNANADSLPGGCLAIEAVDGLVVESCNLILEPGGTAATNAGQFTLATRSGFGPSQNWSILNSQFALIPPTSSASNAGGNISLRDGLSNVLIEGCTFALSTREHIWADAPLDTLNFTYANWTVRRNGFLDTTRVTQVYIANPNLLINWVWENNLFKNSRNAAFWLAGGVTEGVRRGTIVDGLRLVGNVFENIGVGTALLTNDNILLDDVEFAPTQGRSTVISNNRFMNDRGPTYGGWGIWIAANGPGPTITENVFDRIREACILVGGSPYTNTGSPSSGLQNTVISGNTVITNTYGGVVLRHNVAGTEIAYNRNTTVENNVILDAAQYGVSIESLYSVNPVVRFNDISGCGAGIRTSGPATIRGNEVIQALITARAGIWLANVGAAPDVSGSIVAYNVTAGCNGYGIRCATELTDDIATNVDVFNNTVVSNVLGGILLGNSGIDCYNNIVAFHASAGLVYSASSLGLVGYNLLYNVPSGGVDYLGFPGGTTPFAGDITGQNPQFQSLFGLDFHLRSNSPAINAAAVRAGASLLPGGGDMGAFPTGTVSAGVSPAAWELYR